MFLNYIRVFSRYKFLYKVCCISNEFLLQPEVWVSHEHGTKQEFWVTYLFKLVMIQYVPLKLPWRFSRNYKTEFKSNGVSFHRLHGKKDGQWNIFKTEKLQHLLFQHWNINLRLIKIQTNKYIKFSKQINKIPEFAYRVNYNNFVASTVSERNWWW
jgi:hypothetical protein